MKNIEEITRTAERYYIRMFNALAPIDQKTYRVYVSEQNELYRTSVRTYRVNTVQ